MRKYLGWLRAGFRTRQTGLKASNEKRSETPPAPLAQKNVRHPALGALKGTVTIAPGVDLTEPADPDWGKAYD
jgi:hypothetical protein